MDGTRTISTAFLPRLRSKASNELMVAWAKLLFAFMMLLLAFLRHVGLIAFTMFGVGPSWLTLLVSFNTSVQASVPSWVRVHK